MVTQDDILRYLDGGEWVSLEELTGKALADQPRLGATPKRNVGAVANTLFRKWADVYGIEKKYVREERPGITVNHAKYDHRGPIMSKVLYYRLSQSIQEGENP